MDHVLQDRALDRELSAMVRELESGPAVHRPSRFWEHFVARNVAQINRFGIENFKRTVNQNYYNWLPCEFANNQLQAVLEHWRRHPAIAPLRVQVDPVDLLDGFFAENPLLDRDRRDIYGLFVGLLWHHAASHDPDGVLAGASEPELGNPIGIRLDGKLISQDVANSIRERNTIFGHLVPGRRSAGAPRLVVGELGAGYGRFGHALLSTSPARYLVFDIPPALLISQWYLSTLFPDRKTFRFRHWDRFEDVAEEIADADLAFFTPNQLERFPAGYFDVFTSVSTLAEMTTAQVALYLGLLQAKTSGLIYLKQWQRHRNELDDTVLSTADYSLGSGFDVLLHRTDLVQDEFFEMVARRSG